MDSREEPEFGAAQAAFVDDSARRQTALQANMKPVFEARATEIIDHAGRPDNLEDCIGKHTLNSNDLVAEIKEKLFDEKKGSRYLFSERIFVDTCGCYTRDELVKRAAKETFDLRDETKELQQDVARLTEKNALKSSTAETLKQAMAQLSYEWYTAKESVVHMQTNLLNVFENLATNMATKRSREWLRRMFREWCYTARELKVGGLQEHFDMLQQQHTNLCQLLADARQRAEVLEVYVSRRQVAAIKLRDRRLLWECLWRWHVRAIYQANEAIQEELSTATAQLDELSGALTRSRTQRQMADEEGRLMKGAHSLIHDKLLAAQDRTAVVLMRLFRSNALHSFLRRWRLAVAEGATDNVVTKARAHRTQLQGSLTEATQLAEHWKGMSDRYWEKMKRCSRIIGGMRRAKLLRMVVEAWQEEIARRQAHDAANNRIRLWRRKRTLQVVLQAWRQGSTSMSQDTMRAGMALIKEDCRGFRDSAFGWALAAAWAVSHAGRLGLRLAFAVWRENAQVAFYYNLAGEEADARKAAESEADRLMGVTANAQKLRKVIEAWSNRRAGDVRATLVRCYFERWRSTAAISSQGRKVLDAMDRDVKKSHTELMCALTELNELRLFKDGIATSAGTQQYIVKKPIGAKGSAARQDTPGPKESSHVIANARINHGRHAAVGRCW
eukprot:jgi/Tetstr1/428920/TSEL_018896.t1